MCVYERQPECLVRPLTCSTFFPVLPPVAHRSIACVPETGLGTGERGIDNVGGWERCICFFPKEIVTLCCARWFEVWVALLRRYLGAGIGWEGVTVRCPET